MGIPVSVFGFLSLDGICQLVYALSTHGSEGHPRLGRVPDCHGEQVSPAVTMTDKSEQLLDKLVSAAEKHSGRSF
ncbi:MAG: hypothetical protein OXG37_01345 [Actinomycetia bacterium]|nr:hypothetical protein [Actinomycetes bacterium]